MSRSGSTTLYVTGFGQGTRARDLAYEFERYGRLVRCDIPAPRTASSRLFAFVEYESRRDADDAYYEMHNKRIGRDDLLKIEWARTPPSVNWRFDTGRTSRRGDERPSRGSDRSRSPPRRSRYDDDREPRDRYDERDRRDRRDTRDRSRSPDDRDRDVKERDRDEDRDRRDDDRAERERERDREQDDTVNGESRKDRDDPVPSTDDLDTAE